MESARRFVGCKIFVPKELCSKNLPEENITGRILSGLMFIVKKGNIWARIESVFPTGSNDVYVCKGGAREILLPAIADVIRQIDITRGIMTVKLLEGL